MNLYDQLTDWIKANYTALSSDWLYFNAVRMDIGSNSVNSVSGSTITEKYMDGSTENELPFAIALVRLYSAEMSDDNVNAINEVSNLVEWFKAEATPASITTVSGRSISLVTTPGEPAAVTTISAF